MSLVSAPVEVDEVFPPDLPVVLEATVETGALPSGALLRAAFAVLHHVPEASEALCTASGIAVALPASASERYIGDLAARVSGTVSAHLSAEAARPVTARLRPLLQPSARAMRELLVSRSAADPRAQTVRRDGRTLRCLGAGDRTP